jgi:uncharacterized membrane protein YhfC
LGIWIAAVIATGLSVGIGQPLLRAWIGRDRRYYLALGISLFLSPLINLGVKKPVLGYMLHHFHISPKTPQWPLWFAMLALLLVGVSEEAIKLVPVLVPPIRKSIRVLGSAIPMAFAIGLGFALGEIWYVAYRISITDPGIASMPFYLLGGFISERVGTVVVHSFLALVALRGLLLRWPRFLLSASAAMLLHALVDATAMLFQMKLVTAEGAALVFIPLVILCALPFCRYGRKHAPISTSDILAGSNRVLYVNDSHAPSSGPASNSEKL